MHWLRCAVCERPRVHMVTCKVCWRAFLLFLFPLFCPHRLSPFSCVLCQDIVTRHLTEKGGADDQLPPLGAAGWAAGSQSELTPSESLATSDAVRNTLLPRSVSLTRSLALSLSHSLPLRDRSPEPFSTLHPRLFHPSL